MGIPDPDVLREGTNQQTLPGDSMQQQSLRAITRIEKADGGDFEEEEKDHGSEANIGGDEFRGSGSGGRNSRSSSEETFPRGEQGRPRDHLQYQRSSRGQEAVRPNSGHALGRAWPLQVHGQDLPVREGRWQEGRR
ncbi:hypothetical protein NDU88_002506 [Pleurodeles waltl]|uniref:Uncharacterized protein n=1 Tax=Pleurodeles waltl TaxID=8319 RepID=A0AAV7MNB4_PLEWA|nr:hypothetical protein NDU88_002506 [Pleurodeles waltl]